MATDDFNSQSGNNKIFTTSITFYIDSGSSEHIVNEIPSFIKFVPLNPPKQLNLADKNAKGLEAISEGSLKIITNLNLKGILKVLYAPNARFNLLSIKRLQEININTKFENNQVILYKNANEIIATGKSEKNELYKITFQIDLTFYKQMSSPKGANDFQAYAMVLKPTFELWHKRMGHLNYDSINKLITNNIISGTGQKGEEVMCETCILSKQTRKPLAKAKERKVEPLEIVYSDVCGPMQTITDKKEKYFVTFIEAFTHYTTTYLLVHKSEVFSKFKEFEAQIILILKGKGIQKVYCDNGGEYISKEFQEYCKSKGTELHYTIRDTPALNGVAERMNRTLIEKARALLLESGLPKMYWGYAILTATYLLNRSPTRALENNKTPYEMIKGEKPNLSYIKLFGCLAYAKRLKTDKFDEQSDKCILVGYVHNGYKLINLKTKRLMIVRDVIFNEKVVYKDVYKGQSSQSSDDDIGKFEALEISPYPLYPTEEKSHINIENSNSHVINENNRNNENENNEVQNENNDTASNTVEEKVSEVESATPPPQRPRERQPSRWLADYYLLLASYEVEEKLPETYTEAMQSQDKAKWLVSINEELESLKENDTWKLIDRPQKQNIVGCKWIFRIKRNSDNTIQKYKARLVAKGFTQQLNRDYNETFAPVAKITSFRILLSMAVQFDLYIHQLDVKTAFLNSALTEQIFMEPPEGITFSGDKVCKLNKTLYGLKQSSRYWNQELDTFLKQIGFINSKSDYCVYILKRGTPAENIYLVIYVDDILIACKREYELQKFKETFMKRFKSTDLGPLHYYLGLQIFRTQDTISISQKSYLEKVLKQFNMDSCKSVSTPLERKLDLETIKNGKQDETYPCRQAIGCLMYAMICTRPDLCYTVSLLSRVQAYSTKELWILIKRVLRYIKGTLDVKLTYTKTSAKIPLIGYVDANFASNDPEAHSTTGYLLQLFAQHTVVWVSHRQTKVALSTMTAEYYALCEVTRDIIWLRQFLNSLGISVKEPTPIYEDNASCIAIAKNPTNHKGTRELNTKLFFIRDELDSSIQLRAISSTDNLADIFTKSLNFTQLKPLLLKLGFTV